MNIKKIGVIGSGQMGAGITQICSLKGFEITILDINKEALKSGRTRLEKNMARDVEKGRLSVEDQNEALARISWTTEYKSLSPMA